MLASTETAGRAREIYNAGLNSAGVKWRCSPVTLSANVRTKVPAYIRAFGFLGHLIIKSRDYCSMSISRDMITIYVSVFETNTKILTMLF